MLIQRLQDIENRIQEACHRSGRRREDVAVVAVTKTIPPETINEGIQLGLSILGENRVQEYLEKREGMLPHRFHFIGHLQRNKVRSIIDYVELIHSIDSLPLAVEVNRRSELLARTTPVLIEVLTSTEESKYGVKPAQLPGIINGILELSHLSLQGLMTIPAFVDDPELVRPSFQFLHALLDEMNERFPQVGMKHLSMGMTGDFEVAIEEGATLIRLGTALFGPRHN